MTVITVTALILASILVTYFARSMVLRLSVMDIPNDRSSHGVPTPKGAGLGFAMMITAWLLWHQDTVPAVLALTGFVIAVTGFIDDIRDVPSFLRFAIQSVCSLILLTFLPLQPLADGLPISVWIIYPLAFLFIVWLTNLYNFMDGIDGLAAIQGVLLGIGVLFIDLSVGYPGTLSSVFVGISAMLCGFLVFNFPPARVFMGDVGSAFLGFVVAGICLLEASSSLDCLWLLLILLAGFVCDATATLFCRICRNKKVYQAHRTHLYQLVVQHQQQRLQNSGIREHVARTRAHRCYLLVFSPFS
jgi:UDP-N-acetylmuramyl pentapeptide phosphotransferase/UDP-N-acetylglucosamine-1-phosphate transferase